MIFYENCSRKDMNSATHSHLCVSTWARLATAREYRGSFPCHILISHDSTASASQANFLPNFCSSTSLECDSERLNILPSGHSLHTSALRTLILCVVPATPSIRPRRSLVNKMKRPRDLNNAQRAATPGNSENTQPHA